MKPQILTIALVLTAMTATAKAEPVNMANGIKVGEVTSDSAIVWTRLTENPERNTEGFPFQKDDEAVPAGKKLAEMENSVQGIDGEVKITYYIENAKRAPDTTSWVKVDPKADYIKQIKLIDLAFGAKYIIKVEGRGVGEKKASCTLMGSFKTAPSKNTHAKVSFVVVTGQEFSRRDDDKKGHKIYPQMLKLDPSFFVHTGDIEYYDKGGPWAKNAELARYKWNRIFSMPYQREFHNHISSYFMKDDHETVKNDCWPKQNYGDLTWEKGLAIFREQVPMGDKTYRTIRWGKDLQIWLAEGRDFRSPNTMADGPKKTIWGKKQKEWFFKTVEESDATFRILISPTPIVGPDRVKGKNDNHSNKSFAHEGDELRSFIGKQKNMYVICGDRHWQYVSVDPKSGTREYSCGPTSEKHAGGFSEKYRSDMHKYLKVIGGFLSVTVERQDDKPVAIFRHHEVSGKIRNEDLRTTNELE